MRHYIALLILVLAISFLPSSASAQWQLDGVALSTAANAQYSPMIVSDGAGGAIVTWEDTRNGNYDIYARRVNAAGNPLWTADGVALCTAPNSQGSPTIVSDGAGGAIVTWFDYRNGFADIYAQRINASGVPQWTADGVALCTAVDHQFRPTIISDGAEGAIVTWFDGRSGPYENDIYAQRVDATGTPLWTADGVALCIAAYDQAYPTIASDGAGGAIVTWDDLRSGIVFDIYAQRVDAEGTPRWMEDGVALCTDPASQEAPTIVSDGAGGAIVTWQDARGSGDTNDIYTQRVDATGNPLWTADGVALCTAVDHQFRPTIISDGAEGAIVTWYDNRSGTYDIYVQRVTASGTPWWTKDGVALCTALNRQYLPMIVSDGALGTIVAWTDERSGQADIYAQRVDSFGTPQWTADGVGLCTAAGNQASPAIVSDGMEGAIVTWMDERSGPWDIYAQHVNASGEVPTAVSGPTRSPSLIVSEVFPNPFTGTASLDIELTAPSAVRIEIFDVAGRRVRSIALSDAASQRVAFDGRDDANRLLPSGVYFYRVKAAGETITRKMVIAR